MSAVFGEGFIAGAAVLQFTFAVGAFVGACSEWRIGYRAGAVRAALLGGLYAAAGIVLLNV